MNRRLQIINLIGVVVLALVCVLQWRRDRALNLELNRSEKARLEQQVKLAEQEKNLRGLSDDLALFKEQFTRAQSEAGDARQQLKKVEVENQALAAARDQFKQSITNWASAVTERDAQIKQANGRITELAEQLNASIQKFNQLASNHNDVVARYNELVQKNTAK